VFEQVTLLASCVAFALGAVDRLLSVRWFSAYATLNTLMIMLLMVRYSHTCTHTLHNLRARKLLPAMYV
jgi:hypothetical protein